MNFLLKIQESKTTSMSCLQNELRFQKYINHRVVLMAIEKGMLPELIFANKALFSHRAMAAILSAILKMPPIKKAMASKQMRSVYLEKHIAKQNI